MKTTSYFSLLTCILTVLSSLLNAQQVTAQSAIALENVQALVRFGEEITFLATINSSIPVQTVSILISDEAQSLTLVETLTMQPDGRTEFHLDTRQNVLRAFANVKWNYQFTFADGSMVQSEPFFVRYADDRFQWQTLDADMLQINWYDGDASFGQAALDAARVGLESISKYIPVDLDQPIEIFIYSSAADLQSTLTVSGRDWAAGHADPEIGVVMVVLEPGTDQSILMEQRIPHELTHVLMYRRIDTGYQNIPAWLREGMATLAEAYPNADYDRVLADAVASNRLIPFQELCASFPADAGQAFLAYAQSRSFTNYLHHTYGSAGLMNLAASYADGVDCERGTERVFDASLSRLEANWRSSVLGQNTFVPALQNISPYLVLLCLVLIIPLIGILSTLRRKGNGNGPETYVRK